MADNLSTMFKRATISNKDDELYIDELYQRGYKQEQIEFIIRTANYLLDNYPNNYRKKLQAINAVIDILIQNQLHQSGGSLKNLPKHKSSRNNNSVSRPNTRRTLKKYKSKKQNINQTKHKKGKKIKLS